MMRRLGYLVPEFPGQTHAFFWNEIQTLRQLGINVTIISTRRPSPDSCRHHFALSARKQTRYLIPPTPARIGAWLIANPPSLSNGLHYLRERTATHGNHLRSLALLASAIDLAGWAKAERLEHIHGHSCADTAHILALANRIGGPSYSLTLHGDLDVYGGDHSLKMARAKFVCTVGNHLRDEVMKRVGLSEDRVFVTCMGVETSRLAEIGTDRKGKPGTLELLTVARLHPMKGHVHALAAVRRARQLGLDVRYKIAGEGPHRDFLQAQIEQFDLHQYVNLLGTMSEGDVHALLAKADAFVLPSIGKGEAWPVSVMEAMSAGLPVVASIIGATPEMITSGHDGFLVPQGDEDALLRHFALLAADLELRERIGNAARSTAARRFDVMATAALLRDAIFSS